MASNSEVLYLIPGMTSQYPVYSRLASLLPNSRNVDFISPRENETIREYARRMAEKLSPDSFLVGTSFGGILAIEIAQHLKPKGCILVSSVRYADQMPPYYRMIRLLGPRYVRVLLGLLGLAAHKTPRRVATQSTMRLGKLAGTSGAFHRWATAAVVGWNAPQASQCKVLQIHGDADTTFPIRYVAAADVVVEGGKHNLPVTHPEEVADAILTFTGVDC